MILTQTFEIGVRANSIVFLYLTTLAFFSVVAQGQDLEVSLRDVSKKETSQGQAIRQAFYRGDEEYFQFDTWNDASGELLMRRIKFPGVLDIVSYGQRYTRTNREKSKLEVRGLNSFFGSYVELSAGLNSLSFNGEDGRQLNIFYDSTERKECLFLNEDGFYSPLPASEIEIFRDSLTKYLKAKHDVEIHELSDGIISKKTELFRRGSLRLVHQELVHRKGSKFDFYGFHIPVEGDLKLAATISYMHSSDFMLAESKDVSRVIFLDDDSDGNYEWLELVGTDAEGNHVAELFDIRTPSKIRILPKELFDTWTEREKGQRIEEFGALLQEW